MTTSNRFTKGLSGSLHLLGARLGSLVFAALLVVAIAPSQIACGGGSGSAGTCSASEDKACTDTFDSCTQAAAANADKAACQKCVDTYCNCYSACGNSCDRPKLSATCQ
jgi:hypothetical protein